MGAGALAAARHGGPARRHMGTRRRVRRRHLQGLRGPHVPEPAGRARLADLQRQLGGALLRARHVHRHGRVSLGAADDPARTEDVSVPDHAALAQLLDLPGESERTGRGSRGSRTRGGGRRPAGAARDSARRRPGRHRHPGHSRHGQRLQHADDVDHARNEHADRRAADDDVCLAPDLGADRDRDRIRLQAVPLRPAPASEPGEHQGGTIGRRPRPASSPAPPGRSTGTGS